MCSDDLRARGQLQDFVNSGNYELSIMQCADFFLQYAKLPEKSLKRKEFKDWMKHIFLDRGQKKLYERICEQWECAEQM